MSRTSRGRRDLPLSWMEVPGVCGGRVVDVVGAVAAGAGTCDVGPGAEWDVTPFVVDASAGGVRG